MGESYWEVRQWVSPLERAAKHGGHQDHSGDRVVLAQSLSNILKFLKGMEK